MTSRSTIPAVLLAGTFILVPASRADDAQDFRIAYQMYQSAETRGDAKAAAGYARTAYETGKRIYPADSRSLPALSYNLGRALVAIGHRDEARQVLEESLGQFESAYGPDAMELVDPLMELGRVSPTIGDGKLQKARFNQALGIVANHEGRESLLYASLSLEAGAALLMDSHSPDADDYLERAYRVFARVLGPEDARTAKAAFWRGKFSMATGKYYAAEGPLREALAGFEGMPAQEAGELQLAAHGYLVEILERQGKSEEATQHCLAIGRMSPSVPDQMYKPVFRPHPEYPEVDRRAGHEGYVLFEVTIDENGFVRHPVVKESTLSPTLLRSATESLGRTRYAPRFVDGKPVASPGIPYKVQFALADPGGRI